MKKMESNTSETGYKECYVAFLDILGFKAFVEENSFERVCGVLSSSEIEAIVNPPALKAKFNMKDNDISVLCISDSIIISIEKSAPNAFEAIVWLCAAFQVAQFLSNGLLMRGGICCGDFYIEYSERTGDPVLFGKAYNDAVVLEKEARYPRILVSKDLEKEVGTTAPLYLTVDSEDGLIFVDYMRIKKNEKVAGGYAKQLAHAAKAIMKLDSQVPGIKEKCDWTKRYINSSIDVDIFSEEYLSQHEIDKRRIHLEFNIGGTSFDRKS